MAQRMVGLLLHYRIEKDLLAGDPWKAKPCPPSRKARASRSVPSVPLPKDSLCPISRHLVYGLCSDFLVLEWCYISCAVHGTGRFSVVWRSCCSLLCASGFASMAGGILAMFGICATLAGSLCAVALVSKGGWKQSGSQGLEGLLAKSLHSLGEPWNDLHLPNIFSGTSAYFNVSEFRDLLVIFLLINFHVFSTKFLLLHLCSLIQVLWCLVFCTISGFHFLLPSPLSNLYGLSFLFIFLSSHSDCVEQDGHLIT